MGGASAAPRRMRLLRPTTRSPAQPLDRVRIIEAELVRRSEAGQSDLAVASRNELAETVRAIYRLGTADVRMQLDALGYALEPGAGRGSAIRLPSLAAMRGRVWVPEPSVRPASDTPPEGSPAGRLAPAHRQPR